MEKNCLVEKFKVSVNNSNLKYLNGIEVNIKAKTPWAGCFLRFQYVGESFDVLCKDGGNHLSMSSDMSNPTNKITVPVTNEKVNIYVDGSTDYTIVMKCQYNSVGLVYFYGTVFNVNIEDLSHLKNVRSLTFYDNESYGDISKLNNISSLQSFTVRGSLSSVKGSLSDFYGCKTLYTLFVSNGDFSGEITDIADAMVSGENPRTGDTLAITSNGYLTLNGDFVPYNTTKTITFDSTLPGGYSIA